MKRRIILGIITFIFCALFLTGCLNVESSMPVNQANTSKKVLVVNIQEKQENASDGAQVRNALESGGSVFVVGTNDGFTKVFGEEYKAYGAADSDGYVFLLGAALNYIASKGWTLVQAPNSGLCYDYYFVK